MITRETVAVDTPLDFLGLNYYAPHFVRRGDWSDLKLGEMPLSEHPGFVEYQPPNLRRTVMDWLIDPNGLYEVLRRIGREAPELPRYVTENGCAAPDYVNPHGRVNDFERIDYIHGHLDVAWRAIRDGVNLAPDRRAERELLRQIIASGELPEPPVQADGPVASEELAIPAP